MDCPSMGGLQYVSQEAAGSCGIAGTRHLCSAWLFFVQLLQLTKGLLGLRNAEVSSAPFSLPSLFSLTFSFFSPLPLLVFLGEMIAAH